MNTSRILKMAMVITMITVGLSMANSIFNEAKANLPVLPNGRPLMSDGTRYCCADSGNDCGAVCCDDLEEE